MISALLRCPTTACHRVLTTGDDNDDQKHDNADDDTHAHLHVLPPHLFAHSVGASAEPVGLRRQSVGLVLQTIESLSSLRHLCDILLHLTHGLVDFLSRKRGQLEGRNMICWEHLLSVTTPSRATPDS